MKIFEIFICSGMIRDEPSPELRAIKLAKWTLSFLYTAIYFVILRLLWFFFEVKVGEVIYYLLLFSTVFFSWSTLNNYYFNKLIKAKKTVNNSYSKKSIKICGWVGVFIAFIAPICLFIVAIPLISNYKNW